MTKLKNTKKGMAKKALSISLVAAMLATSNVPVWAAEDLFTDGSSAAVEAPVVEEPAAEVEAFSAEPASEAPVVEENSADDMATYATGERFSFEDVKVKENLTWKQLSSGGVSPFEADSVIRGEDGQPIEAGKLGYVFLSNGIEIDGVPVDATNITKQGLGGRTKNNVGDTISARFYEKDANGNLDKTKFVKEVSFGTIQAVTITDNDVTLKTEYTNYQYLGKYIEKLPEITVDNSDLAGLNEKDFTWSHAGENGYNVGTVTVTGTLTPEAEEKYGYKGSVKTTYEIIPRTELSIENVDIEVLNSAAGEYTGSNVKMSNDSVSVKLKGTNESIPVKEVITNNIDVEKNPSTAKITIDVSKLNESENYELSTTQSLKMDTPSTETINISTRDLSKGSAKIYTTYSVNDITSENSVLPKRVTLTGADGSTLTADKLGNQVTVRVLGDLAKYKTPGTYENAVEIKAANVPSDTSKANVIGTVYADLVIAEQSFKDEAAFMGTLGKDLTSNPTEAKELKDYTGEAVTFTKEELGNFSPDGKTESADQSGFIFEYDNNINASSNTSLASITVTGKAGTDYAGCTRTFYFKIKPATVKASNDTTQNTITTNVNETSKGIGINEDATSASDYKDVIGLTIKANNGATPVKSFSLTEGKDYTCEYSFADKDGNKLDIDDEQNAVGNTVKIVATITNKNFNVNGIATINGVTIKTDSQKNTVTVIVPLVKKTIANAEITLDKDSYVYTGKNIVPVVTVKADGKTLEEGKDYRVNLRNALHAGTGTVIITMLEGSDYQAGTQLTKDFTITKADAEDVSVEVKTDNGEEIKYDGTAWTDKKTDEHGPLSYTVKLGDVDVSGQFKATWGENIDAGKTAGKLTLTPTTSGSNDFNGIKEATFEIKGDVLEGTLKLYDENGTEIGKGNDELGTYDYTGNPITFAKAVFTPTNGKKLVEGEDYEITYIDNIASGEAYVCVTGKGNYVGEAEQVNEAGTTIDNIVEGTLKSFMIEGKEFTAKDVTVKNGVYASGLIVNPVVTIVSNGKTLVEGIDYKIVIDDVNKAIDVTTENNIKFTIDGLGEYNTTELKYDASGNYLVYGIDKFDLANATVTSDGETVTVRNGNVIVPSTEYTTEIADGKVTVTATEGNKNYTGTKTVDVDAEEIFVGAPVISEVKISGNKATVVLEGEAEGATGYDYVISTVNDYQNGRLPDGIHKNQLVTETTYQYLDQGIYYAYCHAWTRDENGKKVFGEWSNIMPFSVSAITPEKPVITSVKKSGRNLTVTWTKSDNATGYDIVMGTEMRKVNGELRPVEYGKAVKKITNGNTVTVTFRSIPKGTYYVGLHAYNRTSETGVKVFSPWSNAKKVTF